MMLEMHRPYQRGAGCLAPWHPVRCGTCQSQPFMQRSRHGRDISGRPEAPGARFCKPCASQPRGDSEAAGNLSTADDVICTGACMHACTSSATPEPPEPWASRVSVRPIKQSVLPTSCRQQHGGRFRGPRPPDRSCITSAAPQAQPPHATDRGRHQITLQICAKHTLPHSLTLPAMNEPSV